MSDNRKTTSTPDGLNEVETQEPPSNVPEEQNEKRARSRRLVLRSIVSSGAAATAARSLPDNWTRPVTDSVIMPAHAQVSPTAALACEVQSLSIEPQVDTADADGSGPIYDPGAPPVSGGSSTSITRLYDLDDSGFDEDAPAISIGLGGVSAMLDPAATGDVTLNLTAGGDFTLNTAGPFNASPNGSGVANFTDLAGVLNRTDTPGTDTSQGNLELRFSSPTVDDCVINFTFIEALFAAEG